MNIPAGQPGGNDLTARLFLALYSEFDLCAISGVYVAVPKGVPCFAGRSLGDIARQISAQPAPPTSPVSPGHHQARHAREGALT